MVRAGEGFIEGQADGLDGDVSATRALEEGSKYACRNVATATDSDHEVGFEVIEDLVCRGLAELVHLQASLVVNYSATSCLLVSPGPVPGCKSHKSSLPCWTQAMIIMSTYG